jgi:radical SAM protein with 4Fe4S-binding SPASM domain
MNIDEVLKNNKRPIRVIFEPTINCNLKCPMCDRTHKNDFKKHLEEQLPVESAVNFLENLGKMGTKHILLIGGGEPLLHPDIIQFIKILKANNIFVHLWTNGTLVNDQNAAFLAKNCDIITVSMDSPHEDVNDVSRGVKGATKKVKQSLIKLRKANPGCYLGIHCVISALNYNQLNDFIPFLKDYQINEFGGAVINQQDFVPGNFKIPHNERILLEQNIKSLISLTQNESFELAGCFNTVSKNQLSDIKANLKFEKDPSLSSHITCLALWSQATVRPNGDVSVCCFTYKPVLGNLSEMTFTEVWNSEKANELRELVEKGEYLDIPCIGCDLGHPVFTKLSQKTGSLETFNNMLINSR